VNDGVPGPYGIRTYSVDPNRCAWNRNELVLVSGQVCIT